jgi:hypothetical protein
MLIKCLNKFLEALGRHYIFTNVYCRNEGLLTSPTLMEHTLKSTPHTPFDLSMNLSPHALHQVGDISTIWVQTLLPP